MLSRIFNWLAWGLFTLIAFVLLFLFVVPATVVTVTHFANKDPLSELPQLLCLLVALVFLYLLPSICAFVRKHQKRNTILLINLFTGWSGIGWICSLIWAAVDPAADSVSR
jgi:hypothetical protein